MMSSPFNCGYRRDSRAPGGPGAPARPQQVQDWRRLNYVSARSRKPGAVLKYQWLAIAAFRRTARPGRSRPVLRE